MPADLKGVRGKIDRAQKHFDQLKETIFAWVRTPGNATWASTVEDKLEGKHLTVVSQATPLPPVIPFLIGDTVHNLRCALDHTVCQLAIAAGNLTACRDGQFPIGLNDSPQHTKNMAKWLKGVRPEAAIAIEALQPYKRRPLNAKSDPLWLIHELDNIDKHRVIVVVKPNITHIQKTTANGVETILRPTETWNREVKGAQIFGTSTPIGNSHSEMDVDTQVGLGILFHETGCCDGERVLPTIKPLIGDVESIVNNFEGLGFFK